MTLGKDATTDEPEDLTLRLLREMRAEAKEHFNHLDAALDNVKTTLTELRKTQSAMLEIMSTHDGRLLRIEVDVAMIKKRIGLIEA